jgi:hypothetical protein
MATYDLSDLIGARTGFGLVKTHLENMRVKSFAFADTGVVNSSSAVYVDLSSLNITGLVTTDIVFIIAACNISSGTAARRARIRLNFNTNGQDQYYLLNEVNTIATENRAVFYRLETGLSGTVSAVLQWRYEGSATTLYAGQRGITALVFKSNS